MKIMGSVADMEIQKRLRERTRLKKHEYYMNIAKAVAMRSTCIRRCYGCVIVKDDMIVGTGYNGSPRGEANCCDIGECLRNKHNIPSGKNYEMCAAIHSETNAIINAGRERCIGACLYVCGICPETKELLPEAIPCVMCEKLIKNAGIKEVIGRFNGESVMFKKSEHGIMKVGL